MFEWLFPGWSSPETVAATVGARLLLNAGLVWLVADAAGRESGLALAAVGTTLASAVLMVAVLRGGPGVVATNADLALQVALLAIGGYATGSNPSAARWLGYGPIALGVVAVALPTIVLYGEATVAP